MDISNEAFIFGVLVAFLGVAALLAVAWERVGPGCDEEAATPDPARVEAERAAWDRYDAELRRGAPRLFASLVVGAAALYGVTALLLWTANG